MVWIGKKIDSDFQVDITDISEVFMVVINHKIIDTEYLETIDKQMKKTHIYVNIFVDD